MVLLNDLVAFLNEFMGDSGGKDPFMPNGLQVRGKEQIKVIITGVSASLKFFQEAVARSADAMIVHHGLNMPAGMLFDTIFANRIRFLFEHDLSLIGYHYLLDSHPKVGHNVQIIRQLGGEVTEPYGEDGWGWYGRFKTAIDLEDLVAKCRDLFGQIRADYLFGDSKVKRMVALSGKGAPMPRDMERLIQDRVDFFVTGEPHEWNRELFRESDISFVACGHYNTEKLGIAALGDIVRERFGVQVEFVDLPNEV